MCVKLLLIGLCCGLAVVGGCVVAPPDGLLPAEASAAIETDELTLVARIAHVSDSQIMDEESPARFAGSDAIIDAAWRPYEAYSTQLFDGILRAVNRIHAGERPIDFLVHSGDACDNVQSNELAWFVGVMDGGPIDPLSGCDCRPDGSRPPAFLDPHAAFDAQGIYREAVHGELESIPWYVVYGNHDVFALGTLAIVTLEDGSRVSPLPLDWRAGIYWPLIFDPVASSGYGVVTPADPGPPGLFERPTPVVANEDRAYFERRDFIEAMFATETGPAGHGFVDLDDGPSWYSRSPVAGLRLIGLDTTDRTVEQPERIYSEGAMSRVQLEFLRAELAAAAERDEIVIVTSHHPSDSIALLWGSEVTAEELRGLLNEYPNVVLHLAGHVHRNRVVDRGGYLEVETCSTLDLPQEGRLIEVWRDADGGVVISYEMFSHLDDDLPSLGEDPLRRLREQAYDLAIQDKGAAARQRLRDPSGADAFGEPGDRNGIVRFSR